MKFMFHQEARRYRRFLINRQLHLRRLLRKRTHSGAHCHSVSPRGRARLPISAAIPLKTAAAGNLQPEPDNNKRKQTEQYKSLPAASSHSSPNHNQPRQRKPQRVDKRQRPMHARDNRRSGCDRESDLCFSTDALVYLCRADGACAQWWTIGGVRQTRVIGKRSSRRHHIKCVDRGLSRWQRLDAGRWCDGEAERPRARAAGRGKTCQERVGDRVRIRPYSRDVEVVNVRHVTAYCYCERRTANRGHSWRNAAGRRTTRATTQVHWVDVATCPSQSPVKRCQGVYGRRLW